MISRSQISVDGIFSFVTDAKELLDGLVRGESRVQVDLTVIDSMNHSQ